MASDCNPFFIFDCNDERTWTVSNSITSLEMSLGSDLVLSASQSIYPVLCAGPVISWNTYSKYFQNFNSYNVVSATLSSYFNVDLVDDLKFDINQGSYGVKWDVVYSGITSDSGFAVVEMGGSMYNNSFAWTVTETETSLSSTLSYYVTALNDEVGLIIGVPAGQNMLVRVNAHRI